MNNKVGRYSGYIRPLTYMFDLLAINLLPLLFFPHFNNWYFNFFISLSWIIISINIKFYDVYRFTKLVSIINKIIKQFVLFALVCYAFFGFYYNGLDAKTILKYTFFAIFFVGFLKLGIFFLLKKYRTLFGGNLRNVVIVGQEKEVRQLKEFFIENPDYGYNLVEVIHKTPNKISEIEEIFSIINNSKIVIDEIYCALHLLSTDAINHFIDFTDNNLKVLKFLPDDKELFSRNLKLDYYNYIPIVSLREIALDDYFNKLVKRIFDVLFSIIIIFGIMSWLTPILTILIKLESKGPVFFIQKRNGLNYKEFSCYKFRSMNLNEIADLEQVSKNDPRITRVGRFIRKTSIDELPQFFNVLLGDMSVVGPRPHMVSHTEMYAKKVDKFMVRHFVKPGITGLAQTNGFRGEVENDKDIIYRVKYDIFYMENWSLLLDLKIILMTVVNAVKGEEKAY
jgi:putative colanic acid biosysnthesis UDP-glucose lipid carrier transferase